MGGKPFNYTTKSCLDVLKNLHGQSQRAEGRVDITAACKGMGMPDTLTSKAVQTAGIILKVGGREFIWNQEISHPDMAWAIKLLKHIEEEKRILSDKQKTRRQKAKPKAPAKPAAQAPQQMGLGLDVDFNKLTNEAAMEIARLIMVSHDLILQRINSLEAHQSQMFDLLLDKEALADD